MALVTAAFGPKGQNNRDQSFSISFLQSPYEKFILMPILVFIFGCPAGKRDSQALPTLGLLVNFITAVSTILATRKLSIVDERILSTMTLSELIFVPAVYW